MLVAVNEDDMRVYADEAKKVDEYGNKIKYYCPHCHSELVLKQGSIKIPHFAHKQSTDCFFKGGGESYTHILMKRSMKEIIERSNDCLISELEYKVGSRIADYYFEVKDRWGNCKKIAVECVHRHTDINEFRAKNEDYVKQGVFVIWIFNLAEFSKENGEFKDEVCINKITKEAHTMHFGKVYAVDTNNKVVYAVHLDAVYREIEDYEYIDWIEWNKYDEYFEEHSTIIPSYRYYLKDIKKPNPFLIKKFVVNSFKKAWDDNSLKFLPYRRNVANVYMKKFW